MAGRTFWLVLWLAVARRTTGSMWVVSDVNRYAICLTPKIGMTEALEFIRWAEVPADIVCPSWLLPELLPEVRAQKCAGFTACGTNENNTNCVIDYQASQNENISFFDHANPWADPCNMRPWSDRCKKFKRLTVGRDPLSRLLSAFRNKLSENDHNESEFRRLYLPAFSLDQTEQPVTRLFKAVLATPDEDIDVHFQTQTRQCFSTWTGEPTNRSFAYVANINSVDDVDLDVLSDHLNAPKKWRSVFHKGDVVNGAEAAASEPMCWEGCGAYVDLIEQMRARYSEDIVNLRTHGLPDFNTSFSAMREDCEIDDRSCNTLHDAAAWVSAAASRRAAAAAITSKAAAKNSAASQLNMVLRPHAL